MTRVDGDAPRLIRQELDGFSCAAMITARSSSAPDWSFHAVQPSRLLSELRAEPDGVRPTDDLRRD